MNILIHGAINTSNFGDCLFAKLFYEFLKEKFPDKNVYFYENRKYGIGPFLRTELNYINCYSKNKLKNMDMLIYMSGGYFGERKKGLKYSLKRYLRYFRIGLYFTKKKKPIIAIGIGAGPIYNGFLRRILLKILTNCKIVSVRDEISYKYLIKYGLTNNIILTADTALISDFKKIAVYDDNKEIPFVNGKKRVLFLHLVRDTKLYYAYLNYIIPAINEYSKNENIAVILSCDDGANFNDKSNLNAFTEVIECEHYYYRYNSVKKLISILKASDIVITPKLHVGIVSSRLSKSVLSFPLHHEKTKRFYAQINENERCIPIDKITKEKVLKLLYSYANIPINIDNALISLANKNFELIANAISEL